MPTHAPFTLLTRRLHELNKLIEREANAQNQTTLGITHWEARIIAAAVAVRRPLSVTELAQAAHLNRDQIQSYRRGSGCAPPDVSGADSRDNRLTYLSLTASGRALHRRIALLANEFDRAIASTLTFHEKIALDRGLDKVANAANTAFG